MCVRERFSFNDDDCTGVLLFIIFDSSDPTHPRIISCMAKSV